MNRETVLAMPKVDLHCHLDGSLRLESIPEMAEAAGVKLPTENPEELSRILLLGRNTNSLEEYLKAFDLTLLVLQTEENLERAAYELAEDCHQENAWVLEVRFSPLLHLENGLKPAEVVDAVLAGLRRAERDFGIHCGVIICGMRQMPATTSIRMAELCIAYKNRGVVAFDLAGPERSYPPKHHVEAFYLILNNNINCTIHAGEGYGPESISQALHYCGAHRIGHGTRLRENGDLLNYVNDHRIPLEMCLTSNVQTRSVTSIEEHPFGFYFDYNLRVTLNTDNRLMSGCTITDEYLLAAETFGLNMYHLQSIVIQGFKSSFLPHRTKRRLLKKVLAQFKLDYIP